MSGPHVHLDTGSAARYEASRRVTLVSVVWNLLLTVVQVIIGLIGNSQALVADGFHTLSDLITDFMVLFALKHGRKAADAEHPYGHARIETAVTLLLGVILFGVGLAIAVRAGLRLSAAEAFVTPSAITLWVAAATLAAKEGLFRYTMRVAERCDSAMLRANAWHHRSDAISSLIVVAGIGGSLVGFGYLDSVAAIVVAAMVAKVGFDLGRQALQELIDTGVSAEDLEAIRRAIHAVGGVKTLHQLRTRRIGGQALVDVHILVDDRLSVTEGHQIGETVRARLLHGVAGIAGVMVHIDTEEDIVEATCAHLPLRDEVLARLERHFQNIPEARAIEHVTLHYRGGRIDLELLLPLGLCPNPEAADRLAGRFAGALQQDQNFGKVELRFHKSTNMAQ
jgi:cation diffusion facilitator family transporter